MAIEKNKNWIQCCFIAD